jgi:hypothetical protein
MNNEISFFDFQELFSTNQKCWQYLFNVRWPKGFICPECMSNEYYFIKTRRLWQCKHCHYQCSVTAGTIFHKSRTPLYKLFWIIFFVAHDKNGHSALDLTRKLSISYKVAWLMCQKIRTAMLERNSSQLLAGLIELDDAYYGAKNAPGKRGRGAAQKTSVLVAAQTDEQNRPQFASMEVLDNMQQKTIAAIVKQMIKKGSTIKTDGYPSFNILQDIDYKHLKEVIGDPKNASKMLPWVHIFIANSKSIIRGTYKGVSSQYLQYYLSEFCYKLNRRFNVNQIFDRLIFACTQAEPITLAELRA